MNLTDAKALDENCPLKNWQEAFHMPKATNSQNKIYLCGHSLGLQPKRTQTYVQAELTHWADFAVEGHFAGDNPWFTYHETVTQALTKLVDAKPQEVLAMNSLTTNLHLLLVSFYRPNKHRFKILIEKGAFPSDRYAVHSHIQWHGFDIKDALIEVPMNEHGLFDYDFYQQTLATQGDEIALILLPGVQYLTGEALQFEFLTTFAQAKGCIIGFDLAHAVGNLPLKLNQWGMDFAVWCHYKYLNAGPGAIGGCFVHEKHLPLADKMQFSGWWGHDKTTRFQMPALFSPSKGVDAWQLSNPPIYTGSTSSLFGAVYKSGYAGFKK